LLSPASKSKDSEVLLLLTLISRIESSYVASQLAVCVWVLKDHINALSVGGRGKP
jgi:hypothetical protein